MEKPKDLTASIIHLAFCFFAFNVLAINYVLAAPYPRELPSSWLGTYHLEEFVPPNQDMDYVLVISKDLKVKLKIDGFQTVIRVQGQAVANGNKCTIVFKSNYTDPDLSIPADGLYKPNDVLLTLEKENGKLVTHWGKLEPLEIKHQKPGIYFERRK